MKTKKNSGSVLQITLILLLILSINILSICNITIINSRSYQILKQTDEMRLLKNTLIAHYKYENVSSILLSNFLEIKQYEINYTVDDMGDYYLIETRIKNVLKKENTSFTLELDREKNIIKKVE